MGAGPPGELVRAMRSLSLRTRWLIALALFAVVITGVVVAVRSSGGGEGAGASGTLQEEASAAAEANAEGREAIAQDQTPRSARLSRGTPVLVALRAAITSDVRSRISHGELTGPLQSVRCKAGAAPAAQRRPFECTVRSAGIDYPFLAVADESTGKLTWCKVDPPPQPGQPLEVPVSASCRV